MFHETHFSVMNRRNYHLTNILFNIVSVISIYVAFYQGWFGESSEDFKYVLSEFIKDTFLNPIDLCFLIFIIGISAASAIKKWKNNELSPDISIGLKQYKYIFIPVIIVLTMIEFALHLYFYQAGWLIAFTMIFSNMFIFHFIYVMRLHEFVDDLLEKRTE